MNAPEIAFIGLCMLYVLGTLVGLTMANIVCGDSPAVITP